jgi:hypothetical protein
MAETKKKHKFVLYNKDEMYNKLYTAKESEVRSQNIDDAVEYILNNSDLSSIKCSYDYDDDSAKIYVKLPYDIKLYVYKVIKVLDN